MLVSAICGGGLPALREFAAAVDVFHVILDVFGPEPAVLAEPSQQTNRLHCQA
jgi:hypothetical protein